MSSVISTRNIARLFAATVLVAALLLPAFADAPPSDAAALSSDDAAFLDRLVTDFLFDPIGAEYVSGMLPVYYPSRVTSLEQTGWRRTDADGLPRVYFADRSSVPVPDSPLLVLDFPSQMSERIKTAAQDGIYDRQERGASDIINAAWLHRVGRDDLAAALLDCARLGRDRDTIEADTRRALAYTAYSRMSSEYMHGADDLAWRDWEILRRLARPDASALETASAIAGELTRRRDAGTFGRGDLTGPPDDFAKWDVPERIAYLAAALEDVRAVSHSFKGAPDVREDWRVKALIETGEAAVPALIDAIDKDERFTRTIAARGAGETTGILVSVREAAYYAVTDIIKVEFADNTRMQGKTFTACGPSYARDVARQLRDYWEASGSSTISQRMMKTLADTHASPERLREAVRNLVFAGRLRWFGIGYWRADDVIPDDLRTEVLAFHDPTAAEAVLAAMDRALDAFYRAPEAPDKKRGPEDAYLFPLIGLGDARIVPDLLRRIADTPEPRLAMKYAFACLQLGHAEPWKNFASSVEAGTLAVSPVVTTYSGDETITRGMVDLAAVLPYLVAAGTSESDAALNAVALNGHPYHDNAVKAVLGATTGFMSHNSILGHPFALTILRGKLSDTTPTGITYFFDNGNFSKSRGRGVGSAQMPFGADDPLLILSRADELVRDHAAMILQRTVLGLPETHPIFRDQDRRIAALAETFDRYRPSLRMLTDTEKLIAHVFSNRVCYVPDLPPLGRAATARDVAAGRAVFFMEDSAGPAAVDLPALAYLAGPPETKYQRVAFVVQAELDRDGRTVYGIASRGAMRSATLAELTDLTSMAALIRRREEMRSNP